MWKKENKDEDVGPQRILGILATEKETVTMATYREAVDEFVKHGSVFLEQIPLLTKAQDAYQRALAVSIELRNILDTGDQTMQTLMAQMASAISVQGSKVASDKKPEAAKVEPIRATGENAESARALP